MVFRQPEDLAVGVPRDLSVCACAGANCVRICDPIPVEPSRDLARSPAEHLHPLLHLIFVWQPVPELVQRELVVPREQVDLSESVPKMLYSRTNRRSELAIVPPSSGPASGSYHMLFGCFCHERILEETRRRVDPKVNNVELALWSWTALGMVCPVEVVCRENAVRRSSRNRTEQVEGRRNWRDGDKNMRRVSLERHNSYQSRVGIGIANGNGDMMRSGVAASALCLSGIHGLLPRMRIHAT
jgi:hypothetical protein